MFSLTSRLSRVSKIATPASTLPTVKEINMLGESGGIMCNTAWRPDFRLYAEESMICREQSLQRLLVASLYDKFCRHQESYRSPFGVIPAVSVGGTHWSYRQLVCWNQWNVIVILYNISIWSMIQTNLTYDIIGDKLTMIICISITS